MKTDRYGGNIKEKKKEMEAGVGGEEKRLRDEGKEGGKNGRCARNIK